MKPIWPSWATLAICLLCAAVQLYWGGQDKQGQFHAEYLWANGNLGISLFFLGPYVLFAVSALIARLRASLVVLVLAAVLCGIGLLAGWVDHEQYLRTPPGRETPQMLNFVATFLLWLGSVVVLVAVGISRLRRQKRTHVRSLKVLTLLIAMTSLCGCSKDAPSAGTNAPAAPNEPPALSPDKASPITEQDAPDFDPKLALVWPGAPEESRRRINAGLADETSIYSATLTQEGPATSFGATVYEFSEKNLQASDPKEMLASHGTTYGDEELTRKEIEHGPKKYLGLDVTAKSGDSFVRRVAVLAGTRIYTIEVLSTNEERLNAEDVAKFFESFAIQD